MRAIQRAWSFWCADRNHLSLQVGLYRVLYRLGTPDPTLARSLGCVVFKLGSGNGWKWCITLQIAVSLVQMMINFKWTLYFQTTRFLLGPQKRSKKSNPSGPPQVHFHGSSEIPQPMIPQLDFGKATSASEHTVNPILWVSTPVSWLCRQ